MNVFILRDWYVGKINKFESPESLTLVGHVYGNHALHVDGTLIELSKVIGYNGYDMFLTEHGNWYILEKENEEYDKQFKNAYYLIRHFIDQNNKFQNK